MLSNSKPEHAPLCSAPSRAAHHIKSPDNWPLPGIAVILGFHAVLSVSLLTSPPAGPLPMLCPLPGILFSRCEVDLASFRCPPKCHCVSTVCVHTWMHSAPISALSVPLCRLQGLNPQTPLSSWLPLGMVHGGHQGKAGGDNPIS